MLGGWCSRIDSCLVEALARLGWYLEKHILYAGYLYELISSYLALFTTYSNDVRRLPNELSVHCTAALTLSTLLQ